MGSFNGHFLIERLKVLIEPVLKPEDHIDRKVFDPVSDFLNAPINDIDIICELIFVMCRYIYCIVYRRDVFICA